ncbi:hypothetical protein [Parasphingorhabdus cellanae]|uniref:Uncharacterized protein n=1 Tax=Parasphingorhabdus cellanae TaxID=2806553 RepID=A0ABX7T8G8_9SPHN|nr:hypothetical protein [Parasphingorhabdus cellanae]QTD57198.1 hypothetical protein J4G78_06540 [Parasphingorhabdus cellanae]
MTIHSIHLRKLLQFCALEERTLISALKRELYQDRRKIEFPDEGGGDFYVPFWSDAKSHVVHGLDLEEATEERIAKNPVHRSRLYPLLKDGFLEWWDDEQRGTNELILPLEESVHARYNLEDFNITVKVDNLLSLQIGEDRHRIIYPYFRETPTLSPRWTRVGLWLMQTALDGFEIEDMRILDVQRGNGYSVLNYPLNGDEEAILLERCHELMTHWTQLQVENVTR